MKLPILLFYCLILFFSIQAAEISSNEKVLPLKWEVQQDVFARFNHFTPLDDIEIGLISDIIQDRTGFIWLAGENGLGRFDGYEFKVYHGNSSNGALHGNLIGDLEVDESGRLWIAHSGGISIYIENEDRFENVFGNFQPENAIVDSNYVRALYLDGDSIVWYETANGWLNKYDRARNAHIKLQSHLAVTQLYYRYHEILKDNAGDLFIGGRGLPPMMYDEENNRFLNLRVDPQDIPGSKRENDVSLLMNESDGLIWIGGLEGLYLYDKEKEYFHKYHAGTVYDMIKAKDGHYWLGSGNGAYKINLQTGEASLYRMNINDPGSLGGERIFDIFEDRSGRIWFAHENGVSTHQPVKSSIKYLFHIPGLDQSPVSSRITGLARKSKKELWIGTADAGLDAMDINTFNFRHFKAGDNSKLLSPNIRVLKMHPDGSIYVGFWSGKGFGRILPDSEELETFSYDPFSLKRDWYNDFEFDTKGDVYLGFWGGPGLTIFNHEKGAFGKEFTEYLPDPYADRLMNSLFQARDGKLWVATTQSGLFSFDRSTLTSKSYFENSNPDGGINEELIYDVIADSKENIWASGKQLYRYNDSLDKFDQMNPGHEFSFLEIYEMYPIPDGKLWLLTSKGLMRYDPERNWITDFSSHVKLNFRFSQSAVLQWDEKTLIFGGSNGIAIVETEKLGYQHAFPKVFLTHLDVFNEEFIPLLENLEEISLAYNQNFFTVHFGTDKWEKEQPYTYYYKLEGFNNEWRSLMPQQKSAYFTNVPPGTYVFKMRTGDAYGNRSEQEAQLIIHIIPAWWQRWWFIAVIVILTAGIIVFLWYLRMRDVKMKWQNTDLNQQLLRLQMNPHFIFNSLTSIQNYIYSNKTHLAGQYLSDFARLIRLILENSRHESISLENEIETISLYMELQKLRFPGKIEFNIIVDPQIDAEVTFVPPMMAQPFLENALEHGIKNSKRDGEILVSYRLVGNRIRFEVRDNGIGIVSSQKLKSSNKEDHHESLSLTICKERIQLLERKTKTRIPFILDEIVEDGKVKGTLVAFEIPIKNSMRIKV